MVTLKSLWRQPPLALVHAECKFQGTLRSSAFYAEIRDARTNATGSYLWSELRDRRKADLHIRGTQDEASAVSKIAMYQGPLDSVMNKMVHILHGAFGCAPLSENKQHWNNRDDIAAEEPFQLPKGKCPQAITRSWNIQV